MTSISGRNGHGLVNNCCCFFTSSQQGRLYHGGRSKVSSQNSVSVTTDANYQARETQSEHSIHNSLVLDSTASLHPCPRTTVTEVQVHVVVPGRDHHGWKDKTLQRYSNVTGLNNKDNVFEPVAIPYVRRHENAFIFQDDSARAHRASVVQDQLHFRRITTFPQPAQSPDPSSNGTFVGHPLGNMSLRDPPGTCPWKTPENVFVGQTVGFPRNTPCKRVGGTSPGNMSAEYPL